MIVSFSFNIQQTKATDLPDGVIEYVKKNYPGCNIRFDGLVELEDGTLYLPVLPVVYAEHQGPVRVTMSVPENIDKPDLIIFSNNLSLLKIITNEKGEKTVISGSQVPLKVKLGLLPQDMVVPEGFIIPSDLSSILGDLVIPSAKYDSTNIIMTDKVATDSGDQSKPQVNKVEDKNTATPVQTDKVISPDADTTSVPEVEPLKPADNVNNQAKLPGLTTDSLFGLSNRLLYVINIAGTVLYVVDPQLSKVSETINVAALPFSGVLSPDKKHLYVICMAANSIASINIDTNQLESLIKVGLKPVGIAQSPDGSKIYVTNSGSGNVSVIGTEFFEIINTLEVQGMPDGIVPSNDNKSFYIFNRSSGIVSKWDSLNFENRQFLFMVKNPCAIAVDSSETKLYVSSRTENNLMVYNLKENRYEGVVKVGKKPIDVKVSHDGTRIYTLDAADDAISVIDAGKLEIIQTIDLSSGGFPSSINMIPNENKALITNAESDKITLVDLDKYDVITTLPVGITSKSLVVGPTPAEKVRYKIKKQQEEQEKKEAE